MRNLSVLGGARAAALDVVLNARVGGVELDVGTLVGCVVMLGAKLGPVEMVVVVVLDKLMGRLVGDKDVEEELVEDPVEVAMAVELRSLDALVVIVEEMLDVVEVEAPDGPALEVKELLAIVDPRNVEVELAPDVVPNKLLEDTRGVELVEFIEPTTGPPVKMPLLVELTMPETLVDTVIEPEVISPLELEGRDDGDAVLVVPEKELEAPIAVVVEPGIGLPVTVDMAEVLGINAVLPLVVEPGLMLPLTLELLDRVVDVPVLAQLKRSVELVDLATGPPFTFEVLVAPDVDVLEPLETPWPNGEVDVEAVTELEELGVEDELGPELKVEALLDVLKVDPGDAPPVSLGPKVEIVVDVAIGSPDLLELATDVVDALEVEPGL
jgi:hypothetical protein